MKIPKVIHQIHTKGYTGLNAQDIKAIEILKKNNKNWDYKFYDKKNMIDFIMKNYEKRYLNAFLKINDRYGAAQADYFRYLLMNKVGGAYFDVKSYTSIALDDLIRDDDELLVFEWQGSEHYNDFGRHPEIERGYEYQQWNIISSPNNKYMRNVVEQVTQNIENYNFQDFGVGWKGVLKTTGPIAYTNSISRIDDGKQIRKLGSSSVNGLIFRDLNTIHNGNKDHYKNIFFPIVNNYNMSYFLFILILLPLSKIKPSIKRKFST